MNNQQDIIPGIIESPSIPQTTQGMDTTPTMHLKQQSGINYSFQYQIIPQFMATQAPMIYYNYPIVYNPYYANPQLNPSTIYNGQCPVQIHQNQSMMYQLCPQNMAVQCGQCNQNQYLQQIQTKQSNHSHCVDPMQNQSVTNIVKQNKNEESEQEKENEKNQNFFSHESECIENKLAPNFSDNSKQEYQEQNSCQDLRAPNLSSIQSYVISISSNDHQFQSTKPLREASSKMNYHNKKSISNKNQTSSEIQSKKKNDFTINIINSSPRSKKDNKNRLEIAIKNCSLLDDMAKVQDQVIKKQKQNEYNSHPHQVKEKKEEDFDMPLQMTTVEFQGQNPLQFEDSLHKTTPVQDSFKKQGILNQIINQDERNKQIVESNHHDQLQSVNIKYSHNSQSLSQYPFYNQQMSAQHLKKEQQISECLNGEVDELREGDSANNFQSSINYHNLHSQCVNYQDLMTNNNPSLSSESTESENCTISKQKTDSQENNACKLTAESKNKKRKQVTNDKKLQLNHLDQNQEQADLNEIKRNLLLQIDKDQLQLVKSALQINRQNANKNIIKAFQKYVNESQKHCFEYKKETQKNYYYKICQNEEIVQNQNPTPKELNQFFKKFNKFIQSKTYTNQHIKQIIQNRIYGQILFSDFLSNYSHKWLEQANAVNKDQYKIILEFYKFCCFNQQFLIFLNDSNSIQQSNANQNGKNKALFQLSISPEKSTQENAEGEPCFSEQVIENC